MKNKFFNIVFFSIMIVYLSSCSMTFEKRRYRPGYHVDMIKPVSNKRIEGNSVSLVNPNEMNPVLVSVTDSQATRYNRPSSHLVGSKSTNKVLPNTRKRKLPKLLAVSKIYAGDCDIIYFKNGTVLEVSNIKVVKGKLFYNTCGDATSMVGPVEISTVQSIRLANGNEMIPNLANSNLTKVESVKTGKNGKPIKDNSGPIVLGILAFVCLGLSILFFFLAATAGGYGGIVVAILCYPLAALFAIGAIILLVFAFVTGFRKQ